MKNQESGERKKAEDKDKSGFLIISQPTEYIPIDGSDPDFVELEVAVLKPGSFALAIKKEDQTVSVTIAAK